MKFGVREICDVVMKAKARQKIGNKIFFAGEPVCYFDTLKTSSLEGAATTVYANGGRGNARLMSWDGERTVTFTMEDALISPEGFMILSGAGLIEPENTADGMIYQHVTETVGKVDEASASPCAYFNEGELHVRLSKEPYLGATKGDNMMYVMLKNDDEIISEPYIADHSAAVSKVTTADGDTIYDVTIPASVNLANPDTDKAYDGTSLVDSLIFDSVLVDYYHGRESGVKQINITADSFGGNYYLEASTLFRNQKGVDMPAEFIIPNCRVQSNFTFTMASSGDPSSFTFTMDAFPDYTKFDKTQKVFSAIQIIEDDTSDGEKKYRTATPQSADENG